METKYKNNVAGPRQGSLPSLTAYDHDDVNSSLQVWPAHPQAKLPLDSSQHHHESNLHHQAEARRMTTLFELRNGAAFSELPDDQIEWFLRHVQEVSL